MATIHVGLGGELGAYGAMPLRERIPALKRELHELDPLADFSFLFGCPGADEAAEAEDLGTPYRSVGGLFVVGGKPGQPEAREALRGMLARCLATRTVRQIVLQIDGDLRTTPTIAQMTEFFRDARRMTADSGVELLTETHRWRITEDPRQVLRLHRHLLAETGEGLSVCLDASHYISQIGNPHGPYWDEVRDGRLVFDPEVAGNHVAPLLPLIDGIQLRCAVPNDLGPGQGAIQYPLVDPDADPHLETPVGPLRFYGPWRYERTAPWRMLNAQALAYAALRQDRREILVVSEHITVPSENEYRMDPYRNVRQNLAAVAWAQRCLREGAATAA